jgi:hypothetical protein
MSTPSRPSPARARWAWGVPIVLALVLLVALGTILARSEPRLNGTNSVPLRTPVVGLKADEQLCQGKQLMTAGSGRLRVFLAPERRGTTPKTLVTVRHAKDGVIARARGRYDPKGRVDVPIDPPVRRTRVDAEVCVRNLGNSPIALSGLLTPYGNVMLNGKKLDISLTMLWYAKDDKAGASALTSVIPRVGHARLGGGWAFWFAALAALAAMGAALAAVIREATR